VHFKVAEKFSAQFVFRQHSFYGFLYQSGRIFSLQHFGRQLTLSTWVTRVADVSFVLQLVAGQVDFFCVDDNHVVAAVHMWRITWLVLSSQDHSDLRSKTTQVMAFSINNNPLLRDSGLVG